MAQIKYYCISGILLVGQNIFAQNEVINGQKKNVIWFFGDQHRAQALSSMGDPNLSTPNIDLLSREGTTFMNAYSGCPWSTPFRGSLLTGKYPNKAVYRTPQKLDINIPLISDVFNEYGYLTAYFGKWHLSGSNTRVFVPAEERGRFDIWIGYENNNAQNDSWVHGHDLWGRNDTVADTEKLNKYETDALVDMVIDFLLKRPKDKPFFLVLSVQPPHDPYIAPIEYMEKFQSDSIILRPNVPPVERVRKESKNDLSGYYAQIENLDYNIGRLYKVMKGMGLLETTHLIYFSDHGDCHGSHGYKRKSSPWQESVRIPMIFRPAGSNSANKSSAMMNTIDIAPTTLGLCGIKTPLSMEGFDFSQHILNPSLVDTDKEPDAVLLQHIYPKQFDCLDRPWRGIVTRDNWKYIVIENQPIMLFDLNEDPYELNNLVYLPQYKKKKEELARKLEILLNRAEDAFKVSL